MVRLTSTGARPTDGSSISRIRGASISARASASICCSPPLMEPASCDASFGQPREALEAEREIGLDLGARLLAERSEQEIFLDASGAENSRRPSGTSAMPRSTICSVASPTRSCFSPSISATMRPARGRTMPITHFIRVDLPLPLVPSSTTVSPELTLSDTSSSTRTAP